MNLDGKCIRAYSACLCGLWLITLGLVGCSGGATDPVRPVGESNLVEPAIEDDGARRMIWGYYSGYADTETGEFRLEPLRSVATHFNLVSILNDTGGVIPEVIPEDSIVSDGIYSVRITLFNPLFYNPKYVGFDVRGIFITASTKPVGFGLWTAGENEPRLLNADGWTRWWNPAEFSSPGIFGYKDGILGNPNIGGFNARLNAYRIFADALPDEHETDLGFLSLPGLNDDDGRAVFRSAALRRRYEIQFPPGQSKFNYAVDVSWAPPYVNPPEIPDNFPPNANCPEAWYVRCDLTANTLEYNPATGEHVGNLSLYVTVYDWQGRIYGSVADEVSLVKIHSFDLFNGYDTIEAPQIYNDEFVAMYSADLTSLCQPQYAGIHWLAIEVISANGTYKQSWQAAPSKPLAAYTLVPVKVQDVSLTEPEIIKTFGIRAYVLRKDDGSDPAISDAEIAEDIAWANGFWNRYGFAFELAKKTYINSSYYYNPSFNSCPYLYEQVHDVTGLINLYYFNDIIGFDGAYAAMFCDDKWQRGIYTYIMYDATDCSGWEEVLAHELGHTVGMLQDEYMLDSYGTCANLLYATCGTTNTDTYCDEADAVNGNLMWYLKMFPGHDPDDYFFSDADMEMSTSQIDSQAEHAAHFHTKKPYNFKSM